jgi:hypothetical protein
VYPSRMSFSVPIVPQFVSVASGALASVIDIEPSPICQNWSAFADLFAEFCTVGATFEIRIVSTTNPAGLVLAYIDEKSSSAPTAAVALSTPRLDIMLSSTESPSLHKISWQARDYLDLEWTETGTAEIPAYLKLFAASATTGTAANTTANIIITGSLAVDVRGYASPTA